jgi:hypothetical protein
MQTLELTGVLLDFWVAKAEGLDPELMAGLGSAPPIWHGKTMQGHVTGSDRKYSTDWAHGGPIIERERIDIEYGGNSGEDFNWRAFAPTGSGATLVAMYGTTPLMAAMRAYVAAKFGTDIQNG